MTDSKAIQPFFVDRDGELYPDADGTVYKRAEVDVELASLRNIISAEHADHEEGMKKYRAVLDERAALYDEIASLRSDLSEADGYTAMHRAISDSYLDQIRKLEAELASLRAEVDKWKLKHDDVYQDYEAIGDANKEYSEEIQRLTSDLSEAHQKLNEVIETGLNVCKAHDDLVLELSEARAQLAASMLWETTAEMKLDDDAVYDIWLRYVRAPFADRRVCNCRFDVSSGEIIFIDDYNNEYFAREVSHVMRIHPPTKDNCE